MIQFVAEWIAGGLLALQAIADIVSISRRERRKPKCQEAYSSRTSLLHQSRGFSNSKDLNEKSKSKNDL
jgi:hypothetical protein